MPSHLSATYHGSSTTPDGMAVTAPPTPAVVDALYRAMLGRSPDPEGAAYWATVGSVDAVIEGLSATPDYRQRIMRAAAGTGADSLLALRTLRLVHSDGLAALGRPAPATSFGALPLEEITRDAGRPVVHVLGPYAPQLAEELQRLGTVTAAHAGLKDASGPCDVLVTTDPEYVGALASLLPQHLDAIGLRLLVPAPVDLTLSAEEAAAELLRPDRPARPRLHRGPAPAPPPPRCRHRDARGQLHDPGPDTPARRRPRRPGRAHRTAHRLARRQPHSPPRPRMSESAKRPKWDPARGPGISKVVA